jgi:hypothetical protein
LKAGHICIRFLRLGFAGGLIQLSGQGSKNGQLQRHFSTLLAAKAHCAGIKQTACQCHENHFIWSLLSQPLSQPLSISEVFPIKVATKVATKDLKAGFMGQALLFR